MGISLNGLTPANTYPGLIKTGDNTAISGTPKVLSDGNGNNLPMEVSTTGVNFTNNLTQGGTALQPVLVSGTNIKTINGASLLGSGNIPVVTSPSGVSGAIQFSDGSAFASDATNLFWDDTNKRLGISTNAPTKELTIDANSTDGGLIIRSQTDQLLFQVTKDGNSVGTCELFHYVDGAINFALRSASNPSYFNNGTFTFGATTNLGGKVNIKGSGSTSATTSLLVQNSVGTELFKVRDDNAVLVQNIIVNGYVGNVNSGVVQIGGGGTVSSNAYFNAISQSFGFGVSSINASAKLQIDSTTKGFLPPVMTTTQKNAIASPAAGLVVYDSTTNKLCCYNGSTWNDLF
jgi:hypothetical protein